ncbi:hypothetical protein J4402_00950 [Candidatus Pacearchaeota archaeon]|nr:hypothetical protein [Candidatus Pacearchaeota archaeon]
MGFLDKLKEFFKEEEIVPEIKENIKVEEIDSFLNDKQREIEELYRGKIQDLHKEIDLVLDEIEENIGELERVDISGKKEQERLKDVVNLSKRDYVMASRKFVSEMREDKTDVNGKIGRFANLSGKSYMKANFLIGEELENIKEGIVKIKRLNAEFLRDNSELILKREKIQEFLKKNREKKNREKVKSGIEKDILDSEKLCREYEEKLENLGKEIERVKSGKEYAEREKLVLEKEETERKLKEISEKLNGLLDKKVLEKYIYLDLDGKGIAEKYADDLIQALIEDSELKILSVIAEIRGKISSGEISVKNSAKVFEKLGISRGDFAILREDLIGLGDKMRELDGKISGINLGLDDFFREKIEIENKIAGLKNNIENLRRKGEKVGGMIGELEGELVGAGKI